MIWLSRIISVLAAVMLLVPSAFAETTGASATAFKAAEGITVDGDLSEWNLSSPIRIEDATQIIRDESFWQGPMDCSCVVYVMWDETNLYLAVDVTEDTPFGASEMLELDHQDNFKLFLSTDPNADPKRETYGTNDFMLYLIVDNLYLDTGNDRTIIEKYARERFFSNGI